MGRIHWRDECNSPGYWEEYIGENKCKRNKIKVFRQYLKQAEHEETEVQEFAEEVLLKYFHSVNAIKSIQKT